jgi:hypothetical protein
VEVVREKHKIIFMIEFLPKIKLSILFIPSIMHHYKEENSLHVENLIHSPYSDFETSFFKKITQHYLILDY